MLKALLSLFRPKPKLPPILKVLQGRLDLIQFVAETSEDDGHVITMLAGYFWKFGGEAPSAALIHAVENLRDNRSSNPAVKENARRTMASALQWCKHHADESPGWGDECMTLATSGTPAADVATRPAPKASADGEAWYTSMVAAYGLKKEDMQPLAIITAFAWKHANMPPARAVEFAMQTIQYARSGSAQLKKDAEASWESAVMWSVDTGPQAAIWGMECIQSVRAGRN